MKFFFLLFFLVLFQVQILKAQDDFGSEFIVDSNNNSIPAEQNDSSLSQTTFETRSEVKEETKSSIPIEEEPVFNFSAEPKLKKGEVVLERQTDLSASYKQRRGRHGVLLSFLYEKYYPIDYYSLFRDGYVEDIYGTDKIDLIGGELGYKLNFQLGSLGILINYVAGSTTGKATVAAAGTEKRFLNISRQGISANFALDNLMEEPYIVPYVQGGFHKFSVKEDNGSIDKTATTEFSLNYKVGALFQLNWIEKSIDPSTQVEGLKSSGLQNTFIDVYMAGHEASANVFDPTDPNSEGDPDMKSGFEFGVGLKMEF